ncbi:MAG: asparagine synthase (glutamine-hydrolyzing) [Patescibacteria group bacterium]
MCGIAGFVGAGAQEDLKKMTDVLVHRGPDSSGVFYEDGVGLGHRRLSIIDLSDTGHQPMFSSDKKVGIVFNGEIYNFKELRAGLSGEYDFLGTSDTEVIIALYKKYKDRCFEMLNGMFAMALYDFEEKKLLLVRDRLGKKPLYWAKYGDTILFGSELKSLVQHPLFKKEIDMQSLSLYLQTDYVPTPRTIYKNVFKLEPGTILTCKDGSLSKDTFWKMEGSVSDISFKNAVSKLDALLHNSVKSRMVSDVPLGVFLSGGLDSSTIAYYAQKSSKEKVHTFSVGFDEKSFDESQYAKAVSEHLGTEHHHVFFRESEALDLIKNISDILDEPMADASIVPTYLLSKFTKNSVTVALGGDGGDELFAGYPTFQADKVAIWYMKLPQLIQAFLKRVIYSIPSNDKNFGLGFKLGKFVGGLDSNKFVMHQKWLGTFDGNELKDLLINNNEIFPLTKWVESVEDGIAIQEEDNKLLATYMKTYMMDEVLVKVDRASMKASLETRSPFLDYKIVEFANSLPYSYKIKGLMTKFILKKLMSGKLPPSIINRGKKGFGIPISAWIKRDLKDFVLETLSKQNIESTGIFNHKYIDRLLHDHFDGKMDNRKKVWNLLVFQLWYNKYIRN